jgi:DNA-binding response OmpR family regulator
MSIKCKFCGATLPDGAIYCNNCGKKLILDKNNALLLIDSSSMSNFLLTRKLKQHGFDTKSLSSISFAFDELLKKQYTALIVSLDLELKKDIDFLRKVRTSFKNLPIILLVKSLEKQHLTLIKELDILLTVQRPINIQELIKNIEQISQDSIPEYQSKYPIHKKTEIEKIIK